MPAFDVTANPTQLTLKGGTTGTIVVTVTNRLGRSVIARADKIVEPATAAAWVKAPADSQRTFSDQPATQDFRYEITIPPNTPGMSFKFRVDVVEVGATDDNFGQGNTVQVTVPAVEIKPPPPPPKIPIWVWPLVAVVVIGVGIGLYLMLKNGGGMPNVVEKQYDAAEKELQQNNMVVVRVDSLSAAADTTRFPVGAVLAQTPAAEAELKGTKEVPDTARLVVQKDFTVVPLDLVNIKPVDAANKLGPAGLFTNVQSQASDSVTAARGLIIRTVPASGALAVRGDSVAVVVGSFCSRSIPRCNIRIFMDAPIVRINEGVRLRRPIP
jgi:hypothetical protein